MDKIRDISPFLVSYNIEMAEVTGGAFWKAYTPGQIAGTEEFPPLAINDADTNGMAQLKQLMEYYPPIDLSDPKLRYLAAALGPCWVRVSGTWATGTYFDPAGRTGLKPPKGYSSVLTGDQWRGVLDFVKAVGGKLLISVANCDGVHSAQKPWNPSQAKLLFDYSLEYGVPIEAAEFMNEPNMLSLSGGPQGYTQKQYARNQDLFYTFVRKNYPDVLLVGPSSMCPAQLGDLQKLMPVSFYDAKSLLEGTKEAPDVFSYHCYNGTSARLAFAGGSYRADQACTNRYLDLTAQCADSFLPIRDAVCPGAPVWVTESADAGGGGSTWASTYLDVFRTLTELGSFAKRTDGVIFHNTLASSDYGLLSHSQFEPRPDYFALLLWNRLMGTTVYDVGNAFGDGYYVYLHSRKDGEAGYTCLIVNNSLTDPLHIRLEKPVERYTLSAESLRSPVMMLNGDRLKLTECCLFQPEQIHQFLPESQFCFNFFCRIGFLHLNGVRLHRKLHRFYIRIFFRYKG